MSTAGTGNYRGSWSAEGGANITPSDSVIFPQTTKVWVGGAGNLVVRMAGSGSLVTFTGVLANQTLDISVTQVMATGTTATNIVGLN